MHDPDDTLFEAVIRPHRSLSRRGAAILAGALCGLGTIVTTLFWLLGAWPVAGFNGAEILLAVLLLRANGRARRASEVLRLSERALRIVRTDPKGRVRERSLAPDWLNAVLEERPGRTPALWLVTRGVREQVAEALGEAEKRDLAQALRDALHRAKNPVFDNPQLRELPQPT